MTASPVAPTSCFTDAEALELYRRMLVIRKFEERTARLYADGVVPGFVHLSIGQEATAVGACWPLRDTDGITSNHRGHGHCLAKGASPAEMYAELMGRVTGACGGLGGSMHIADFARGVYGANGIVAGGLSIAAGVAQGFRHQGRDDVVVAFFGDGAVAQGAFHEAVNLAALWHLPVLFFCENNHYAEFSPAATQHPVPIIQRGKAYGIEAISIDGNDVEAVASTVAGLVERMRGGEGPFLVEALTYRWHGHYEGDQSSYRTDEELAFWQALDPIVQLATRLDDRGLADARLSLARQVAAELAAAEEEARAAPFPDSKDLFRFVEAERAVIPEPEPVLPTVPAGRYRTMDAIHDALQQSLVEDPAVYLAGIDVGAGGNIFGLTRGLFEQFPGRVLDTPISESALVGLAVGSAMTGARPIVEIMYMDFIGVCFDQLMNQAAKMRFMTGGKAPMSLVVRTQFGSGKSSAAQHSQSLEALLAHIPGLTVVMPSTPEDAYGLLRAAIADPNPVIFVEHRLLYGKKGVRPPADHLVPLGKAAIRRAGTDVTLVSWSRMVDYALEAAEIAAARGISVEVIDLRTVSPLDEEAVLASVERTTRLVIAQEAVVSGGLGAEIAARVSDRGIWRLAAPIKRVGAPFTPAPYSPALEADWLPTVDDIVFAILEVCAADSEAHREAVNDH
jgi:2-oxoisovalerate dehydrogenase E1 component